MLFNRKTGLYLFAAAVAGWVICCYNPFLLWFQNDDFTHLFLSRNGIIFQTDAFRPLCDVHRIIEYHIWGKNPAGYHTTNIVLHFACAVIFGCFAKRVALANSTADNANMFAITAAALFLIFPSHSESTFWILGDTAILGAVFPLVCLLYFLKPNCSKIDVAVSLAAYILSLLTYESGWVTPVIAFVLQWQRDGCILALKNRMGYFAAQGIIFIAYIYAKAHVNSHFIGNYEGAFFLHFNLSVLAKHFLGLVFISFVTNTETPVILFAGFIILFATVLGILLWRWRSFPVTLWLCFFISVLPYLSLGVDTHGTEGGRFIYLPAIFVVLIIMQAVHTLKNSYAQYALVGFAVVLFAVKLYTNAVNYRFAGGVVKQTLTQLAYVPDGRTVMVEGLPASQHGAVILRSGINDAIRFYLPQKKIIVHVLNLRDELNPLQMPYKTTAVRLATGAAGIKYVYTDSALLIFE